jgi:Arc/MetJ-type ribon-helix-helix transcriptional regulator
VATTKITVTVPDDILDQARAAVARGAASSVSAYAAAAIAERAERERKAAAILERWGPFSDEALAWANRLLDGPSRPTT